MGILQDVVHLCRQVSVRGKACELAAELRVVGEGEEAAI
ncbi:hypothetical protein NAS2_0993 [Conexivisphaera calida]|uniref:Uncharacterized protein n=2 Tax=Conexivisphaera calida TaxID=1874277 RepID=A0A4P2VGJ9_9ARCH|nr:hypothetical protein NAS2_0993 [Conexivisphaera calida]